MQGWPRGKKQIAVSISSRAERQIDKLDKRAQKDVYSLVKEIEKSGTNCASGCFKCIGHNGYSARIGGSSGIRVCFEKVNETKIMLSMVLADIHADHRRYDEWCASVR